MNIKANLQLHIHSNRSFDSRVPINKYVEYFSKNIPENDIGILGITDHNAIPITSEVALKLSKKNIIVMPGIEWRLSKTLKESVFKLCTRREILTLGNHDDFKNFLLQRKYKINDKNEITDYFTEDVLMQYLA